LTTVRLGQLVIGIVVEDEFALPSRVCDDVQAEEATTVPFTAGIVTLRLSEEPLNVTFPLALNGLPPPLGVKTTFQPGVFSPLLPLPDEAKAVQLIVTEPHVAVAAAVCA
jgi:hypothetical protein